MTRTRTPAIGDGPVSGRVVDPDRERQRRHGLAEVAALAWLLDNSIPVPGTGRRFGVDALIGLVPGIGDVVSGAIGLIVVWRGSRLGLPRVVVARMLLTTLVDFAMGSIPIAGDAFDLWFKASTRNLALMRRYLEEPDRSTSGEWAAVFATAAAVIGVVLLVGWIVASAIGAIIGAIS